MLLLACFGLALHLLTILAALIISAPHAWVFPDSGLMVLLVLLVWAGLTLAYECANLLLSTLRARLRRTGILSEWRRHSVVMLGAWPINLLAITIFFTLCTSNITLISLHLLQQGEFAWLDQPIWQLEQPLFHHLLALPLPYIPLDILYNGCWINQLGILLLVMALSRDSRQVFCYAAGFILLFFCGRFLGLLFPVKGPAFLHPEIFTHLNGLMSAKAMHYIADIMQAGKTDFLRSAILVGGVSALPSLHIAMISYSALWFFRLCRWTVFLTLPWVLTVWLATIVLGWHYAVDGLGGLLLGTAVFAISTTLLPKGERYFHELATRHIAPSRSSEN